MMEVKDGLEGEAALTSELGLRNTIIAYTACSQWLRRAPAAPNVLLHDMHDHHAFPPIIPNPMHEPIACSWTIP